MKVQRVLDIVSAIGGFGAYSFLDLVWGKADASSSRDFGAVKERSQVK